MSDVYRAEFALWSAQQAKALRSAARECRRWIGRTWPRRSTGALERRALASPVRVVIEHLMKLHLSPADGPRNGWKRTIRRARVDIEAIVEASPSLRWELPAIIGRETARARPLVADDLAEHGENPIGLATLTFNTDQVTGTWLP